MVTSSSVTFTKARDGGGFSYDGGAMSEEAAKPPSDTMPPCPCGASPSEHLVNAEAIEIARAAQALRETDALVRDLNIVRAARVRFMDEHGPLPSSLTYDCLLRHLAEYRN